MTSTMSLYCPHCQQRFDDHQGQTCPNDGARLFRRDQLPDDPLVGTVLDDLFRIDALLSEGGMGAVYRATQLSVQRTVALKVVRPDLEADDLFIDRFFREAKVIAGLNHPNIIHLIDFGQDTSRDILYLVMELVDGIELGDLITLGRLHPSLALEIAYQVCAGLTQPHQRGIIHRDLKPANIIVLPSSDGTFQVKILDFGIARPIEDATQLTQSGMICGTPSYLSPEQAQSDPVEPRSDLYSLGVLLFEMLTGYRPFRSPSGLHLLFDHVQRPAPDLASSYPDLFPRPLGDFLLQLLEKSPEDRPHSAIAARRLIQRLRQTLDLDPVFLPTPSRHGDDLEAIFAPWLDDPLDPDQAPNAQTTAPRVQQSPVHPPDPLADTAAGTPAPTTYESPDPPIDPLSETAHDTPPAPAQSHGAEGENRPPSDAPRVRQNGENSHPKEDLSPPSPETRPTTTAIRRALQQHPVIGGALATSAIVITAALLGLIGLVYVSSHSDTPSRPSAEKTTPITVDDVEPAQSQPQELSPDEQWAHLEALIHQSTPPSDNHEEEVTSDPPETEAPSIESEAIADADDGATAQEATDEGSLEVASAARPSPPDPTPPPQDAPSTDEPAPSGITHQGSVVLESASQVDFIEHYEEITGDLVIRINHGGLETLRLPNLSRVRGNLIIDGMADLDAVILPNLTSVDRAVMMIQNQSIQRLEMNSLESIGENLILNHTIVHSFDVSDLKSIGGMVNLMQNAELNEFSLPSLSTISGSLSIMENPGVPRVRLPHLQSVGAEVQILSGSLRSFKARSLRTIGSGLTVNRVPSLAALELPALQQVSSLLISEVPDLERLRLPSLERVSERFLIDQTGLNGPLDLSSSRVVNAQLTLNSNPYISVIDLTSLETVQGDILVSEHDALDAFRLGYHADIEELRIMNSPNWDACPLKEQLESWKSDGWTGSSRLINVDDSQCPS